MLSIAENFRVTNVLSALVSAKAGFKNVQPSDCRWLAADISRSTGEQLSATTLKRFFGFAAANFQVSLVTKNILSRYLDYARWDDFLAAFSDDRYSAVLESGPTIWKQMQSKALRFSTYTFKALKNRAGIPFEATIDREFAEMQIRYFLDSDYPITSFIGQGGAGKSILLSRLVNKFWLDRNPVFKNDIVWFISGQTLGGLMSKRFDFETWIGQQAGLNDEQPLQTYFNNHPSEIAGKMILVLDGFDEIMHKDDLLYSFFANLCDFITRNRLNKWLKIIFSVRTSTWSALFSDLKRSTFIKHYWYLGTAFASLSNVPPLKPAEVEQILNKLYPDSLCLKSGQLEAEMLTQLGNPFYIQLLYQLQRLKPKDTFNFSGLGYHDLVSEFINHKIYQTRYSVEKLSIIQSFLDQTQGGENVDFIEKELLLLSEPTQYKAYYELISYGVLVEEVLTNSQRTRKIVFFNHINLLEYFLCIELLNSHQQVVDISLFKYINRQFRNSRYQLQIYKWLIYYAVSTLQKLDTRFLNKLEISSREKKELVIFFAETLGKKYISHSGQPDRLFQVAITHDENYFSCMLSYEFTGHQYEQALEIFLILAVDKSEKRYLHSSLALRCFNNLDAAGMVSHIIRIKELGKTFTGFKIDPLIILEVIYGMAISGDRDAVKIDTLVNSIRQSTLIIDLEVKPFDHLLHSLILSFMQVTNQPQVSLAILGILNADMRRSLFAIRHQGIYLAYFIHYVHICLKKRQPGAFRLTKLVKQYLDMYPSTHLSAFSKIGYEVVLAEWSLIDNQLDLAGIFLKRIHELCTLEEHNFYRILAHRNLVFYYEQRNMQDEKERLLYQLRAQVSTVNFQIERLLGLPPEKL